jgi:hypothetical protein
MLICDTKFARGEVAMTYVPRGGMTAKAGHMKTGTGDKLNFEMSGVGGAGRT